MAAVIALFLLAVLSVAGCTQLATPVPPPAVPTPVPTSAHNPVLENLAYEITSTNPQGWVRLDKHVTWNCGNMVSITYIEIGNTDETKNIPALASNVTFMAFASAQDASKYVDSLNKSYYVRSDMPYDPNSSKTYRTIAALGTPSVYQSWYHSEGTFPPSWKYDEVIQYDAVVQLRSSWVLGFKAYF